MDPVGLDRTHILVLNYNGRALLEECLPSVVAAARGAGVPCPVTVIDNSSTDDSVAYLAAAWPEVRVRLAPNRGLASFNDVLPTLDEPAVLLLNNDVKLDPGAVPPLLQSLDAHADALFSAPLCWDFDGATYEGMRTRVRQRFGLVQGRCRVPGHERFHLQPDQTAAAGPVLAVRRDRFLAVGGYDPLYRPGRIEDLDLGYQAWMHGFRGYYVPASIAYHRGFGSFGPAFGARGNDRLALRNTILFCWKNLHGARLAAHLAWLPARLAFDLARGHGDGLRAVFEALGRLPEASAARRARTDPRPGRRGRQDRFFRRFAWEAGPMIPASTD
jgi:GT2 family glycosyltransferase